MQTVRAGALIHQVQPQLWSTSDLLGNEDLREHNTIKVDKFYWKN